MTDGRQPGARRQRLTVFLADLMGGGAERMMVVIANGMAERGMDVRLVLAAAEGPYVPEVSEDVELVDLGVGSVSRALAPLARDLRRNRPDVMLTTLPHTSFVAVFASRLAGGVPTVVREAITPRRGRRAQATMMSRLSHMLAPLTYRLAAGTIAVSDGVKDAMVDVLGVPPQKIAALYNPVVTPELRRLAAVPLDHPWFAPGEPPVILGVGSLSQRKDFATLIEAFSLVRDPAARLVILGEGPERAALEAQVERLGLGGRVQMPGFVSNPYAYMANADLYVMSSRLEGLPGTLVQALACGCPAVSTDCPSGPREVLQDGSLGPLVPVGDAREMAHAIEETLRSPPHSDRLIAAVDRYDAARVLDQTHAYLVEIAGGRAS